MAETRINLRHLLEDIRDSYSSPIEEAIITELIANSLDSGASEIRFFTNKEDVALCIIDNGSGMNNDEFVRYHDIAASAKTRGQGIGFAGVGIKLALLCAESIITETKRDSLVKATQWKLENNYHAPWNYIKPQGLVTTNSGTSVSIFFRGDTNLLNQDFIKDTILRHYYPILNKEFMSDILKYVYKNGVSFFINNQKIELPPIQGNQQSTTFIVQMGKKDKPIGIGFLSKCKDMLREEERGVAISTYGKIIKRGWDWIQISPLNPMQLTGIVEVPQLSKILTTNKADFLKDQTSLQIFYRYRKAIQEVLIKVLKDFGEISTEREKIDKDIDPLVKKEIEKVLHDMLPDFPELNPLFGRRQRADPVKGIIPDPYADKIGEMSKGVDIMTGTFGGDGIGEGIDVIEGDIEGEHIDPSKEKIEKGREHEGRRKRPGLMIGFEDNKEKEELGWLIDNTVWINKGHPAYRKSINSGSEIYHIVLSVAWVLSSYLEGGKSPQVFINRFLSYWGNRNEK